MGNKSITLDQFKKLLTESQNDKLAWREFFISRDFLDVQYEKDFVMELNDYLHSEEKLGYANLPQAFVVELSIAYGTWPNDMFSFEIDPYEDVYYE